MAGLIARYERPWTFAAGDISHPIYSLGTGPDVVVLHEAPGMTEDCLSLGLILGEHFRVHLPLLFDRPGGANGRWRTAKNIVRVCVSHEIHVFATNQTSPLVGWLRALCRALKRDSGDDGVGVIGMCLTGGLALALIADDSVIAPVVAQPSMPFLHKAGLGMSRVDRAAVRERAAKLGVGCVLGLRYAQDRTAPAERMEEIRKLIGPAFRYAPLPGNKHATLTRDRHATALSDTIAFLSARLGARVAP
jgi:dienelactone hydrolase